MQGIVALLVLFLMLSGCQTTAEKSPPESVVHVPSELASIIHIPGFDDRAVKSDVSEIVSLSDDQLKAFHSYFYAPSRAYIPKHRRLYRYIDNLFVNFTYLGHTLNATNAFQTQSGNCMSLAILTTALAESVGLDVAYQRVNVAPVYRRYANVMTLSTHVRTHLFAEEEDDANEIVVLRSKIIIDYYPQRSNIRGDMISDGEFFAMYYRNLASDAIISGELDEAYKLMRQALDVAPTDPENLNTLAVLLNKMGHSEKAFELYAYAINEQQTALNLLSNYAQLLTKHGRIGEAQAIQASMQYVEDDNPYRWLDNAEYRIARGQHLMARRMLERTLENAPYLHEAYFALAKSYYLTQEVEKADAALKRAAELAYLPETERLYEQKRSVLSLTEAD